MVAVEEAAIGFVLEYRRRGPASGQPLHRQIDRSKRQGFQVCRGKDPSHSVDGAYHRNLASNRKRCKQVWFGIEGLNNIRPNAVHQLRELTHGGAVGKARAESIELVAMILNAVLCEREHGARASSAHSQAAISQSCQERDPQSVILASHAKQVQRHAVSFRSRTQPRRNRR